MLNIQDYQSYSGEKKIALMDNSTVSFLEQAERAGISTKELLEDYDAILITDLFQRRNAIAHPVSYTHLTLPTNSRV